MRNVTEAKWPTDEDGTEWGDCRHCNGRVARRSSQPTWEHRWEGGGVPHEADPR